MRIRMNWSSVLKPSILYADAEGRIRIALKFDGLMPAN